MMETPQILSIKPIRKWGHSQVVTVGREVRQALNVKPGDLIAFRKIGRYVFILAVNAIQLAPVTKQEMALAREALGG
jgi:antitoxin component of MazEF toxin-antitoxin module